MQREIFEPQPLCHAGQAVHLDADHALECGNRPLGMGERRVCSEAEARGRGKLVLDALLHLLTQFDVAIVAEVLAQAKHGRDGNPCAVGQVADGQIADLLRMLQQIQGENPLAAREVVQRLAQQRQYLRGETGRLRSGAFCR